MHYINLDDNHQQLYTRIYIFQSIDQSITNCYIKYYLKDLSPYRQAILVLVHEYVNLK